MLTLTLEIGDQASRNRIVTFNFTAANLQLIAGQMTGPDRSGIYASLSDFLTVTTSATTPPPSYRREVDLLWQHPSIQLPDAVSTFSTLRRFIASRNGELRTSGGYSTQGYQNVNPDWYATLLGHRGIQIVVDYYPGRGHDLMVVRG